MAGPFFTRPNFHDRQIVQYSGQTITLSGDTNINQTGNFRIQKGAFPGLVATSLDSDGTVVWGPISGLSWSISACTSPLYVNNLVSCPSSGGTIQVDAGNLALNSELNFLISLSAGTNTDDILVIDSGGYVKTIPNLTGVGNMWHIPVGYTLTVPDNYQSFVYGDILIEGTIDLQTNAQLVILNGNLILSGGSIIGSGTTYLVTLGGNGCCFTGGTGSCITDLYVTNIHGCSPINIQPTSPDDVYMVMGGGNVGIGTSNPSEKLHVSGDTIVNGDYLMLSDNSTSIPSTPNFKGFLVRQDYDRLSGYISRNTNVSGGTGLFMFNDSSVQGLLYVASSQYLKGGTVTVPNEFYQNKIILKGGPTTNGMVFNATSGDASAKFWWEFDGSSGMVLKGDGSTGAYLGLALNPDGTEMPTSNLQIGGTGTTGTVQVNQDVLNVNAKNTYGKVRPNYYTTINSGTTSISAGIYPITISSGWVIEQVQIYTKIPDSVLTAGSLVNITTSGGTWSPGTSRPFGFSSGHFANMINIYGGTYVEPVYFPIGDTLLVSFVDPFGSATSVTDGEYKVLITYWDGSEIL